MTRLSRQKVEAIEAEVRTALAEIARRHGIFDGLLTILPSSEALLVNATLLADSPEEFYGAILENHPINGLSEDIKPGTILENQETNRSLRVLGRDPDDEDRCLLLFCDDENRYYRLSSDDANRLLNRMMES